MGDQALGKIEVCADNFFCSNNFSINLELFSQLIRSHRSEGEMKHELKIVHQSFFIAASAFCVVKSINLSILT